VLAEADAFVAEADVTIAIGATAKGAQNQASTVEFGINDPAEGKARGTEFFTTRHYKYYDADSGPGEFDLPVRNVVRLLSNPSDLESPSETEKAQKPLDTEIAQVAERRRQVKELADQLRTTFPGLKDPGAPDFESDDAPK
jgi:hypothetical protein